MGKSDTQGEFCKILENSGKTQGILKVLIARHHGPARLPAEGGSPLALQVVIVPPLPLLIGVKIRADTIPHPTTSNYK